MKTIDQHNAERRRARGWDVEWTQSGVECPHCKHELLVNTRMSLTSDPPQNPAHCPNCGINTYLRA